MQFETHWISQPGGREQNQDRCGSQSLAAGACWVLADGLGGHGGGEVAASIAVEATLAGFEALPPQSGLCSGETLQALLESANHRILERQIADPRLGQMRTTAVLLVTNFQSVCWGHTGDSRLYFLRQGAIAAQTRDHSVPQSLVEAGKLRTEEIRFHSDRNRLLRALGSVDQLRPSIEAGPQANGGDAFLLCSDGFWEYVTEIEMQADYACAQDPQQWLARMEERLLRKAPPDHDNYSAIAIFVY